MKRTLLAVMPTMVIALGSFGLIGCAVAHDHPPMEAGPGPHGPGMGGPGFPMLEGLDLTSKQKSALHDIFKQVHEDKKDARDQGRDIHEQITNILLTPGAVDKTQLATLQQQEEALHAKEDAARLDVAVKIHDLLTPEQLAKAKARHDQVSALLKQLHDIERPGPQPE
ncbi:Spy/CpxP family protein refolding chaperone [Acetobacter sp. DsW_063]|uniref:Spy/CpxP family protein refolding chaperone n=1 Tax=Acetobacter sp. DsW_063 TaxID=1514894 RepID=UPI000A3D5DDB|nr:Spy/CpxP family protein refolding chaperone [Acetobacter sp. DsW_063]